ncbi:MAG: hypothetical protein J7K83_00745 [Candidatus Aenigmarchaeota archaeon]|nr:hypothetical protein [Candidatus Aenigmarchaeota archaeon]
MVRGLKLSKQLTKILTKDGLRSLSDIPEDEIMLFADDANAPVTFYDETSKKRKGYFHTVAFSEMLTKRFLEGKEPNGKKYVYDYDLIERNTIVFIPYFIEGNSPFRKHSGIGKYYDIVLSKTLNEYIAVYRKKISAIVLCSRFFYDDHDIKLVKRVMDRDKRGFFSKVSLPALKKTTEYHYKQYTGDVGTEILQDYIIFGIDYDVITRVEDRYGIFLYYDPAERKKAESEKAASDGIVYLRNRIDFFDELRDLNAELKQLENVYKKKRVMVAV